MFGINGGEFFLIGVVALLVLGPERLPILARKAGKWTREMRAIAMEFRSGIERELGGNSLQECKDEIDKPVSELRSTVSDIRKDFNQTSDDVQKNLNSALSDSSKGLAWTGPVAPQGPTPEDAANDLARIEAGEDLLAPQPDLAPNMTTNTPPAGLDELELGADLDD
jgi:sec-independent protein translocase protein TatB